MSTEMNTSPDKKKCPNCSHMQPIKAKFCQKCGISFTENEGSTQSQEALQWRQVKKRISQQRAEPKEQPKQETVTRKCSKCNAIIESTVLEQCPLCMSELSPLPSTQKENLDRMLFTGKKLVSEKEIKIDRNVWTSGREIFNVFLNSVLIFIFVTMGAYIFQIQQQLDTTMLVLITLLSTASLGVYPLIYIGLNHLNWKKIGLKSEKIALFITLGVLGGIGYYFFEYGLEYLWDFIPIYPSESPLAWLFNKPTLFDINSVEFPLRFAFYAAFLFAEIFEEFLFRGILHNGIYDVLKKKNKGNPRFLSVILTSLFYSTFYLIFFISSISGYTVIFSLVLSLVVGIVYELSNRSLVIVITLKMIYVGIGILFTFIPLF